MEVLIAVIIVAFIGYALHNNQSKKALKDELTTLGEVLDSTLTDHERDLEDHKAAERELYIVNAKLSTLKETTLTPDNSVPKSVYQSKIFEMSHNISNTQADLQIMTEKFEESRGKQISNRVKMGQIGEQFVFFNEEFKYNRKETKSLLQPIDLVCFEETEVVFVEVKTGNAQLSTKQRRIRDNIKAGRVRFEVLRVDENGFHWSDK